MKKKILQIVLFLVIIVLAYFVYKSIDTPVQFEKKKVAKEILVIQDLKDIRAGQQMYKKLHDKYAADIDTLMVFLREGQIPIVKQTQDPNDTTMTIKINDTIGFIGVADSLYQYAKFSLDSLPYIPESGKRYELAAGTIESGGYPVHVFEAKATYKDILFGLDNQLIINLIKSKTELDQFPGLKVGSMTEASTDGNWE
jgi:hypothetical protein